MNQKDVGPINLGRGLCQGILFHPIFIFFVQRVLLHLSKVKKEELVAWYQDLSRGPNNFPPFVCR